MKPVFEQNDNFLLNTIVRRNDVGWVEKNTAILVVHGIGDQLPLQTLDQFGRGLVKQFKEEFNRDLKLKHELVTKRESSGEVWFDNVLRISKEGSTNYIDLYEYYWANLTQDKASWKDINSWLQGVVKGAKSFYKRNAVLGKQYKDHSPFFDNKTGNFKVGLYRLFLSAAANFFFIVDALFRGLLWLVGHIPFLGQLADSLLENYMDSKAHDIVNIVGEVAIYNVVDPKNKLYEVRRKILDGAVAAVRFLLEKQVVNKNADDLGKELEEERLGKKPLYYASVIIAGHSLGTQVSYDAINKINLLVNKGEVKTYDETGTCRSNINRKISDQLNGFITFGCPLDKIVFFLRENVPDSEYLRQQFLDNYHDFKQRDLDGEFNNTKTNESYVKADCGLERLLDSVQWRNYYDDKDYVSGGLDYYYKLTNINCKFKTGTFGFTHSYYWDCQNFYIDIISNYLSQ